MEQRLVSVIVPVRNGERFLAAALESAYAQDYPRLEVVVVDDGSTDGSAAVARSFPARCVFQANRGVAAARNAGIAEARGDYLAFLDQDDLWMPEKLRLQADFLDRNSATAYALTYQRLFLEEGVERPLWLREGLLNTPQIGFVPSALMARREAFDRVGLFDPSYVTASDSAWFFRAVGLGLRPGILASVLVRRRIHDANQSHEGATIPKELLRVAKAMIASKRGEAGPR